MSEQILSVSMEQRIIIKFLTTEGVQSLEILQRLEKQFEEAYLTRTLVLKQCKTFRERVEDMPHNRRPRTSIIPSNIDCANMLIRDNRDIIVKEFASICVCVCFSQRQPTALLCASGSAQDA